LSLLEQVETMVVDELLLPLHDLRFGLNVDLLFSSVGCKDAIIISELMRANASLTSLDVGFNEIGKEEVLNLVSIFKQKDQMKSVGLANCNLGVNGAKAVADYVSVSASLTECNLRGNDLDEEGWCLIFDALRDNPQNKIAKWDLTSESINSVIAKSLAAYVAVSASLTSVNILTNKLGIEGATVLLKVRAEKPMLRTLYGLTHTETAINLQHMGLGPADAMLLAPEVAVIPSLTALDVEYNSMGDEGNALVREAVKGRVDLYI
jgi:hypothetical protein